MIIESRNVCSVVIPNDHLFIPIDSHFTIAHTLTHNFQFNDAPKIYSSSRLYILNHLVTLVFQFALDSKYKYSYKFRKTQIKGTIYSQSK